MKEIRIKLEQMLSHQKVLHSIRVQEVGESLAATLGVDKQKVSIACLLHDCAKEKSNEELLQLVEKNHLACDFIERQNPSLLHGKVGALVARDVFGVYDQDILNAIQYHTTGREGMHLIEQIVLVADFIEPKRKFSGIDEIRTLVYNDFGLGLYQVIKKTLLYVVETDRMLHLNTVKALHWIQQIEQVRKTKGIQ